ncbi:MAG: hypothetical protein CL569_15610 [Alphaproteobacteria bacterium]|nr:hypothetical protein [Alphaproteobacteria bacterium]
MNVLELVIFDCDGVLVDSEPIANRILTDALAECGLKLSRADVAQATTGHSMSQVLAWAEGALGNSLPEDFVVKTQKRTFDAFHDELRPIAGAASVLDAVAAAGVRSCVASSGDHEKMKFTLGLTGLLAKLEGRIFSASDVANGKPAPDLFLLAAQTLDADASGCVVIEDSLPGVAAGLAAGMKVYGYAAGMEARQVSLAEAGALVFDRLQDLPGLLGLN